MLNWFFYFRNLFAMQNSFHRQVLNPIKFRLFLLRKLPAAFFSGVKVLSIDEEKAVVSVPYKWFSTNPFHSTYFACLGMAAEMSTGLLLLAETHNSKVPMSTLVIKIEGEFLKKAVGKTFFTCVDATAIRESIKAATQNAGGTTITTTSSGKNSAGETIAIFKVTWTIRAKK